MKALVASIGILLTLPCAAQESSSQASIPVSVDVSPKPAQSENPPESQNAEKFILAGVYGAGGKLGEGGVYIGGSDTGTLRHPGWPSGVFELGVAHTPARTVDGVFSANLQPTFNTDKHPTDESRGHLFLFLNGGYARFFKTGNAAEYGGGVIWRPINSATETRFEYREYYIAGWGRQEEVRVAWDFGD
ncbi:MAG TPA: hypothetical protein VL986_12900 [Terracidiphilus sp.]|nr:hypothetical protein [Terracidiphilus sp.]